MARQMKDSGIEWIGEIPEGWRTCKIKDIFQVVSGATPKSEQPEYWDGDIVWVTPADYKTNDKFVSSGKRTLTQAGYDSCGTTLVPAGSIVFSKRAPIGSVAIAQVPLCTNQGCLSCINRSDADTTFFYYVMSIFTEIFELYGSGTTFKELSFDNFTSFAMPNPDSSEQQRIAAFLDRKCAEIDAVIERTKATIEEYKKLKQAVITEAVTKGVRGPRPMKDSGIEWIGEIPEGWGIRKLFRTIDAIGDIDHYMPESVETGIPYLMTGDLKENASQVRFDLCKQVSAEDFLVLSAKIKANKGDVIFARYATIGAVCYVDVDIDFLVSYSCLTIKPTVELLLGKFLFYYLKSTAFYEDVRQYINSNTQANVGLDSMTKAKISLPPVCEQEEIVTYLDEKCAALDTLIAQKTALLTELETYKKSLIYEYVTGKKEVQ